jgi:hypothetical protein
MATSSPTISPARSQASRSILWGWLAAGVLDLTAAFVNSGLRGRSPLFVLHTIASGLLGAEAFNGGLPTAALGVAIHFLIAFVATVVYYAASRKLPVLIRHAVICGLLYGVAVYAFMNLVVLRIAFSGRITYTLSSVVTGMLILMLFVGLPIALAIRRYSASPVPGQA